MRLNTYLNIIFTALEFPIIGEGTRILYKSSQLIDFKNGCSFISPTDLVPKNILILYLTLILDLFSIILTLYLYLLH